MSAATRFLADAARPLGSAVGWAETIGFLVFTGIPFVVGFYTTPWLWLVSGLVVASCLALAGVRLQRRIDEMTASRIKAQATAEPFPDAGQPRYRLHVGVITGGARTVSAQCVGLNGRSASWVLAWGDEAEDHATIPAGQSRWIDLGTGFYYEENDKPPSFQLRRAGKVASSFRSGATHTRHAAYVTDAMACRLDIRLTSHEDHSACYDYVVEVGFDNGFSPLARIVREERIVLPSGTS